MTLKQVVLYQYQDGRVDRLQVRTIKDGETVQVERVFQSDDGRIGYRQGGSLTLLDDYWMRLRFPNQLEPYVLVPYELYLPVESLAYLDGSVELPYLFPKQAFSGLAWLRWQCQKRFFEPGNLETILEYMPNSVVKPETDNRFVRNKEH